MSGGLHGLVWVLVRHQQSPFRFMLVSGIVFSILILGVPQVALLFYFNMFDEGIIHLPFFSMQLLGISFAAWRLNLRIYKYLMTKQLIEE